MTRIPTIASIVVALSLAMPLLSQSSNTLAGPDLGSGAAAGTPGVLDDTCFKTGPTTNHHVSVNVKGNMMGTQTVTITEGANFGSTNLATPDPDGGCADSTSIAVGTESYKIEGGKVKWENPAGLWITMSEEDCPEEDKIQGEMAEEYGTLPLSTRP